MIESLPVRYSREGASSGVAAIKLIVTIATFVGIPIALALSRKNPEFAQAMAQKFLPRIHLAEEPGKPTP